MSLTGISVRTLLPAQPELELELVPEREQVRALVPERVLELEQELVRGPELEPGPAPEPEQHKPPPNHPSKPLPSPKKVSVFYSIFSSF